MGKWLTDEHGFYLSPGMQKSADAHAARRMKKHKTNCEKFYKRALHRFCPICNIELTSKNKLVKEFQDKRHPERTRTKTMFVCPTCRRMWYSAETNKVWIRKRPTTKKNISNAQFKSRLIGVEYE